MTGDSTCRLSRVGKVVETDRIRGRSFRCHYGYQPGHKQYRNGGSRASCLVLMRC